MKFLLRIIWRIISLLAHVTTWVVSLAALAIGVTMAALLATSTKPIVITSGSMVPIIPVRAVVLAHQVDASQVKIGDVVTAPTASGENVTHRVVQTEDRGTYTELTMKGDANKTIDPATYKVTKVYRMVTVVPAVGKLLMGVRSPAGMMTLGTLFGCLVLTFLSRVRQLQNAEDEIDDSHPGALANLYPLSFESQPSLTPTEIDIRTEELERQKGAFFTAVNQDLRTPMTSIMGYLELLTEGDFGEVNEEQREALTVVKRNADRLQGLVGNMLTAAEIEGGHLHPSLGIEVDPSEVLHRVRDNFEALASDRSIDFDVITTGDLRMVQGSFDQIKTCVDHLVSNAIKFTPDGGRVTVRSFNEAGMLTITVSDTGMGIEPRFIDDLCDNFFRTPAAEESAHSGSGIGLAIVKAIVSAYDGSIAVDSVPGIGSTFTIKFPTVERAQILASEA